MNAESTEDSHLAIGIDGGGTKTLAWLGRLKNSEHVTLSLKSDDINRATSNDMEVLGRGESGPSNPLAVGFEVACQNLELAIELAFADAKLKRFTVQQACFCLAGAGRREEQEKIESWARTASIAGHPRVIHDGEAILAAAKLEHGITLIAGTGSLAWGRSVQGDSARSGGWGYLLDDVGSGYWLGLEALKAVVRAADFRAPETELTTAILKRFDLREIAEVKPLIYSQASAKHHIASLAEDVFATAQSCPVATSIVREGVRQLAKLVEAVTQQLQLRSDIHSAAQNSLAAQYSLAVGGTVLVKQPEYCMAVIRHLRQQDLIQGSVTIVDQPVCGALRLALSRGVGLGGGQ